MIPKRRLPTEESPRRYIIRKPAPPERTVRIIRQTTPPPVRKVPVVRRTVRTPTPPPARVVNVTRPPHHTPPPPVSEPWYTTPRRQTNSDTQIVDREPRVQHNDRYPTPPPLKKQDRPEMYHIASITDPIRQSPLELPVFTSRTPTPKPTIQTNRSRKPNRIEPMEQQTPPPPPPEPRVVKRVYKNHPPPDDFSPNENEPHPTRKPANYTPPPKHHQPSPRYTNGNNQMPGPNENPTVFYIRNTENYQ